MAELGQIGHFEILEKLGAGGMGEVFRARDLKLNRFVALKLLPEAASDSARERFQREALAIAALNHPHICTLYEAGEEADRAYLVMELLEGETLFARLARGPVGLAQIAQWGGEIADALQAAHGKGILHRDLKPGNIFVTRRGAVKVLDFGLAQFALAADAEAVTMAGTRLGPGAPLTHPGTTLGTFAYMSPEQARGEATDARSDLFSLGVVLYEMAGGRAPFQGRTSADLTAAILMLQPPPPSTLRPELPPRLDDIVGQCLEKDPDLRYQSAADLRVSLRRLVGASSAPPPSSSVVATPVLAGPPAPSRTALGIPAKARAGWRWPAAAAAVVVVGALGWLALHRRAAPPSEAGGQLQLRQLTFSGQVQDAAISPDGKFLAHVDSSPQGTSLHLLSIAGGAASGTGVSDVEIMPPAAGCCQSPTFSPDGSSIYFVEDRDLKAVPVLGGGVRDIATEVCSGAGFSPDGKQIAYVFPSPSGDTLLVAQADGTQARALSNPHPAGYNSRCWLGGPLYPDAPAWSPDGRQIAVDRSGSSSTVTDQIVLVSVRDGSARALGPDLGGSASDIAWLPDGSGLLVTVAMPFTAPPQVREISYPGGQLLQLTHDLQGFDRATIASQAGGVVALVHSSPQFSVWRQVAVNGAFAQLPGGGADQDGENGLAWAPPGNIVSVRQTAGRNQLWIEGGSSASGAAQPIPISNLSAEVGNLGVAPNGEVVFAGINPGEQWRTWRVDLQGTGLTSLTPLSVSSFPGPAVTAGGRLLAFVNEYTAGQANHQRLWVVPLAGGAPREVSPRELYVNFLLPLPDQKHVLALASAAGSDGDAVLELPLDGSAAVVVHPREYRGRFGPPYGITPDGRALTGVIMAGNVGNIWAAPLDGGPLYEITHFTELGIAAYAFAPDGRLAVSRGSPNSDAVVATGLAGTPPGGRL